MSPPIIEVHSLGKRYRIGATKERYLSLRDELTKKVRRISSAISRLPSSIRRPASSISPTDLWALRDVSFSVQEGEAIGIIGRNGAGKSTLLKILSQITPPTEGNITMRGRVGSLLEVGTGFHPELTGRENIYMNGAILGMNHREIARKFDEIVAFAEMEKFLDTPVKHYSSGMYVRLAFAVAAHLEPEILLVDEVLAVGDAAFQKKCLNAMDDVARHGRTILIVSHNMSVVSKLCARSVWLKGGEVHDIGDTQDIVHKYLAASHEASLAPLDTRVDRIGTGRLRFTRIEFEHNGQRTSNAVVLGREATIVIGYAIAPDNTPLRNVSIDAALCDRQGQRLLTLSTRFAGVECNLSNAAGELKCHVLKWPLIAGQYSIDLWCGISGETVDYVTNAATFGVIMHDAYGTGHLPVGWKHGVFMCEHSWDCHPSDV